MIDQRRWRWPVLCAGLTLLTFLLISTLIAASTVAAEPQTTILVVSDAQEVPFVTNGNCTLGEAIHAANTDTAVDACPAGSGADVINLQPFFFLMEQSAPCYNQTNCALPTITSDITIESSGGTTIQRGTQDPMRFFFVGSGAKLTLKQIALVDGLVDGSGDLGGAVLVNSGGTLIVEDVQFSINRAPSGSGGAIAGVDETSVISVVSSSSTSKRFLNNEAQSGGAIAGGTITVSNTRFSQNKAANGSAIFSVAGGGPVTLINSSFFDNAATSKGTVNVCHELTVDGGEFGRNTASSVGGAIFYGTGPGCGTVRDVLITNSSFAANFAASGGGAISAESGFWTISDTLFRNNTTSADGGAIKAYLVGSATATSSTAFNILDSTFETNQAAFGGGLSMADRTTTLENSVLISNTATSGNGGALFKAETGELALMQVLATGNEAAAGGALVLDSMAEALTVQASTISANHGRSGTGGVHIASSVGTGSRTMRDSVLANNSTAGRAHPDLVSEAGGLDGRLVSGGYNYFGASTVAYLASADDVDGSGTGDDPMLLAPENYVSKPDLPFPIWHMLPRIGGPLMEQIPSGVNGCQTTAFDLRGFVRVNPFDGVPAASSECEIGAFERGVGEQAYVELAGGVSVYLSHLRLGVTETSAITPLGSVQLVRTLFPLLPTAPKRTVVLVGVTPPNVSPAALPLAAPAPFDLTVCYTEWELAKTPTLDESQLVLMDTTTGEEIDVDERDLANNCVVKRGMTEYRMMFLVERAIPLAVGMGGVSATSTSSEQAETSQQHLRLTLALLLTSTLTLHARRRR